MGKFYLIGTTYSRFLIFGRIVDKYFNKGALLLRTN
ncbi:hypothetical protein Pedsa_1784 [Pseudopedobacter saltans DSM 12145]|uniref:Uncharacterized protein n=1 Tax=Pseudopedobacter saltans (strain ATCC 51119 / DSM 12145 / JCM 21818 / CCUG 39354 / LMG 10337 / NBRC 100064 / NCIMB 13643) TaxID=762903 RepID=F0S878_PSESL|nr:hypothetical protein Pedsa_1784 [Pseudopedobacter saltans DSM 12145]